MRRLALAVLAMLALPAAAVPPGPPPAPPSPPPPPLVILIEVDQLTGALFDRYRTSYTGGLARLARGTVFRNGQDGVEGESFGSLLKRRSPDSQHIVVSGEASAAPASQLADQRWSWTGRAFTTAAARPPLPKTVALANAAVARLVASPEAGLEPPASCQPTGAPARQFARAAGDYAAFTGSPALDGATLALAAGLIGELGLGRDRPADVVSIDLAGTGNVGSRFGAGLGDGTCVQLQSLDRDLGAFFDTLDRAGLYYAVALSGADSSAPGSRVPILVWRAGMVPMERLEAASTNDIAPTLAEMLGVPTSGRCLRAQGIACKQP